MTKRSALLLAFACLLTLLLYIPGLHGPFIFDDYANLGALIKYPDSHGWQALGLYLSESRDFPGRPLSMLSFYPQRSSWPDHSFPFKLVNTLLHLLCGLAVAWLLALLARTRNKLDPSTASLVAVLTTAAWLLDPIQLSTVMLVVQRMTLLSTLFMVLGLALYTTALTHHAASLPRRALLMVIGLAGCAPIALLCKETGALLPLYALILDTTLLSDYRKRLPKPLRWLRFTLVVMPATVLLVGLLAATPYLVHGYAIRPFTLPERLLTESRIIYDYLGQIFLPLFSNYTIYHDDIQISTGLAQPSTTLLSLACTLVLVAISLARRNTWPLLALAVFWYLGGQWLESTSISLELYFEHRTYMPMIGPLFAVVVAIAEVDALRPRKVLMLLGLVWLGSAAIATATWARVWASPDTLALTWARFHPQSARSQSLLAQQQLLHHQVSRARDTMQSLANRLPADSSTAIRLVEIDCQQNTLTSGQLDKLQTLLTSVAYDRTGYLEMEQLREQAQAGTCKTVLSPVRWSQLADALLADPYYQVDHVALGFLHYQKSQLAVFQHNLTAAIHELQQTDAMDPDPEIPREEARYLMSAGLYDQAITTLRTANAQHYPLLRRLLVNDRARWDQDIATIESSRQLHSNGP
ncbi:tetratricopeptide repeat protein [Frateuria aurantia]